MSDLEGVVEALETFAGVGGRETAVMEHRVVESAVFGDVRFGEWLIAEKPIQASADTHRVVEHAEGVACATETAVLQFDRDVFGKTAAQHQDSIMMAERSARWGDMYFGMEIHFWGVMKIPYSKCITLAGEILLTMAEGPITTSRESSKVPRLRSSHATGERAMGT